MSPTTRHAAAYLRRSVVTEANNGEASREAQLQAVTYLLEGERVVVYDADWGISGAGKATDKRKDYLRLKADIAADKVSTVAAYSLSRLGRSTKELLAFFELCDEHGTVVRTKVDATDTSTASGKLLLTILSAIAEFESQVASERIRGALAARKSQGGQLGSKPLGFARDRNANGAPVFVPDGSGQYVLDAYREAGTLSGAARLLTERGYASPRGKPSWSVVGLRAIIEKLDPSLLPPRRASGRKQRGKHLLSSLVVCHCGRIMSPDKHHGSAPWFSLYCSQGRMQGPAVHGRYSMPGKVIGPLLVDAAKLYHPPVETDSASHATRRAELTERLERLGMVFAEGAMTPNAFKTKAKAIRDELATISDDERAIESLRIPEAGIDWDRPEGEVNADLTAIWRAVHMTKDYLSASIEWRVGPEYFDEAAATALEAAIGAS